MNHKQFTFTMEMLRHGDKILAYSIAYQPKSPNYRTIESAANRLLQNPEIANYIESTRNRIQQEVEAEVKEQLKAELLTVHRKRQILARIAEGDVYIEQTYKGKGCQSCTQMAKPTINQMLKAIDIDNRMAGDYVDKRPKTIVHANVVTKPAEIDAEPTANSISHAALRRLLKTQKPQQNTTILTPSYSPPYGPTRQSTGYTGSKAP